MTAEQNEFEDLVFDLDPEQLANLRLEFQSISPDKYQEFQNLIVKVHESFLRKMKPFLAFDIEPEAMIQKFVFTDPETYSEFVERWEELAGKIVQKYSQLTGLARAFSNVGNLVVTFPLEILDYISEEEVNVLLQKSKVGMTDDELYLLLEKNLDIQIISHEMTHLYQYPNMLVPLWLLECQAYWLTTKIMVNPFMTSDIVAIVNFFQTILDKYGDEVHKLCFGASDNEQLSRNVQDEFTPEIQESLFPEYFDGVEEQTD